MMEADCTCSLCGGQFGMETEGGVAGYVGILPVQFCPTCWAGIDDFVSQRCQYCIERDMED